MQSISDVVSNVPSFSVTQYALKISMACILLWHQYGICAEIKVSGIYVSIQGVLETGDDEKFRSLTNKADEVMLVEVDSRGGMVETAMQIGLEIRKRKMGVIVHDGSECASSCVLILAAGLTRIVYESSKVTIHRPVLTAGCGSEEDCASAFQRMYAAFSGYFSHMRIPVSLLDKMISVSPEDGNVLSNEELRYYLLSVNDPVYDQEKSTSQSAGLGVNTSEYYSRKKKSSETCAKFYTAIQGNGNLGALIYRFCETAILEGVEREIVESRVRLLSVQNRFLNDLDEDERNACVSNVVSRGDASCLDQ